MPDVHDVIEVDEAYNNIPVEQVHDLNVMVIAAPDPQEQLLSKTKVSKQCSLSLNYYFFSICSYRRCVLLKPKNQRIRINVRLAQHRRLHWLVYNIIKSCELLLTLFYEGQEETEGVIVIL